MFIFSFIYPKQDTIKNRLESCLKGYRWFFSTLVPLVLGRRTFLCPMVLLKGLRIKLTLHRLTDLIDVYRGNLHRNESPKISEATCSLSELKRGVGVWVYKGEKTKEGEKGCWGERQVCFIMQIMSFLKREPLLIVLFLLQALLSKVNLGSLGGGRKLFMHLLGFYYF